MTWSNSMRPRHSSWQAIRRCCTMARASLLWAPGRPRPKGSREPASLPHGCVSVLLWSSADWPRALIPRPIKRPWLLAAALLPSLAPPLTRCILRPIRRCNTRLCASTCVSRSSQQAHLSTAETSPCGIGPWHCSRTPPSLLKLPIPAALWHKGGRPCASVGGCLLRNRWRKTRPSRGRPRCCITVAGYSLMRRSTACATPFPTGQKRTCVVPFPSYLAFVSLLQYAPRGTTAMSQMSRTVTYKVKSDGFIGSTRVIAHAARRVAEHLDAYAFLQDCFGSDVTLVPLPRSS